MKCLNTMRSEESLDTYNREKLDELKDENLEPLKENERHPGCRLKTECIQSCHAGKKGGLC
jgi:hypothetical protein